MADRPYRVEYANRIVLMPEIPYLKIVPSAGSVMQGDCGICAVATLTNNTYEDVVAVAVAAGMNWKHGLYTKEIIALAAEFDVKLRRRRKGRYDMEHDVGILEVDIKDLTDAKNQPHVVLLNAGIIVDWDATVWSPDAYLTNYQAELGCLLALV